MIDVPRLHHKDLNKHIIGTSGIFLRNITTAWPVVNTVLVASSFTSLTLAATALRVSTRLKSSLVKSASVLTSTR